MADCLTDAPENRIPFAKPEGYDPKQYELLLRVFNAGWRETFGSKHVMDNLEKCCTRFEDWREKRDPGVNAKTRNFLAQLNAAAKAGKSQAAAS